MERKDWKQIKIELSRKMTRVKLQLLPFLRSLDMTFFMRLFFFGGVLFLFSNRLKTLESEKVTCKQEGLDSPTRYSKTFG